MAPSPEMRTYAARLESFQTTHQLSKRRASSQSTRRKNGQTAEWPHERPTPEDLARAGFYFHPSLDNPDNVQCFLCDVKLDGWEPADDALSEHVAHASSCPWATSLLAGRVQENNLHNPLDEVYTQCRAETFTSGDGWPHESKRGWKCKIKKMVEAGWVFDPSPEYEDGATCFYCELSLDGWEPKDDPAEEHRKRAPDCAFFALAEQHGGAPKKSQAKSKGKGRSSAASRTSRLSTQSAVSVLTDVASLADVDEDALLGNLDDSLASNDTVASQATTKPKKATKATKAKATKGRKRANTVEKDSQPIVEYPSLALAQSVEEPDVPPSKANNQVADVAPNTSKPVVRKKAAPRKPKAEPKHEVEDVAPRIDLDVSAQLQDELEDSISVMLPPELSPAPQLAPANLKRGTKRTSNGSIKEPTSAIATIAAVAQPKAKRGKKASVVVSGREDVRDVSAGEFPWIAQDIPATLSDSESKTQPPKATLKKAASKKGKTKKTSSDRSASTVVPEVEQLDEPAETGTDGEHLDADEMEIEAELVRIATESQVEGPPSAIKTDVERVEEYEPSPSRVSRHSKEIRELQGEIDAESLKMTPSKTTTRLAPTASPCGSAASDKENVPSSAAQPPASHRQPVLMSPTATTTTTTTTRVPLAPSTPNRSLSRSPSKTAAPNNKLSSDAPWSSIDLDMILLASPQPRPTLAPSLAAQSQQSPSSSESLTRRLADAAAEACRTGRLTSPEKTMTVEEWFRWRAGQGEDELRRKCEAMVGVFEREGLRALRSLEGIPVASA